MLQYSYLGPISGYSTHICSQNNGESSYHFHDEVTTHKALLCRLLETRVLWGKTKCTIYFLQYRHYNRFYAKLLASNTD